MRRSGAPVDALAPLPGASPGLLRRRYSVPETIMRKYRLAQLRSADTEESETATAPSPLRRPTSPASPSPSRSPSRGSCSSLHARRDREVMRKSALLRRLWSKNGGAAPYASSGEICCKPPRDCQACETVCGQCDLQNSYDSSNSYRAEPKSLDGSQNDLRQLDRMSGGWITRTLKNQAAYETVTDKGCECCRKLSLQYPVEREARLPPSGYSPSHGAVSPHSPKRQRLESPSGVSRSNEMLKAAMRNSYDKMEESHRQRETKGSSNSECLTSTASSTTLSTSKTETSTLQSSQLSTYSYPATSSETSFTKTPTSHSSEDPPNLFRFTNRPTSVDSARDNKLTDASSSSLKKRRQSVCIYMNSLESPCAEIKSESVTTTEGSNNISGHNKKSDIIFSTENEDLGMTSESTVPPSTPLSDFSKAEQKEINYSVLPKKCHASTNTEDYTEKAIETNHLVHVDMEDDKENIEENPKDNNLHMDHGTGLKDLSKNMKVIDTTEMIEIVVSEMVNSSALMDTPTSQKICGTLQTNAFTDQNVLVPLTTSSQKAKIDLDEYVSNILIQSLNTLTDQIEGMNSSIGGDRKVNILEKEIKVKLQNVESSSASKAFIEEPNTEKTIAKVSILETESETANNNGNIASGYTDENSCYESQLKSTYQESYCNNNFVVRDYPSLQRQIKENSDEKRFTDSMDRDSAENDLSFILSSDKVNQAVLQQIQKLFKDGFNSLDSNLNYTNKQFPTGNLPEISHIEISNVDVFIENHSNSIDQKQKLHLLTDRVDNEVDKSTPESNNNTDNLLSKMSTATYYKVTPEPVLVPRFTAYPNTESMEVNTSSSDEGDIVGSDCTSLVDSLDDPNSPRVKLSLQQSRRRTELVRSSVDVLELLPDITKNISREHHSHKDKSESFFIRIKDDECDCEKENIVVADHMPDKIRQKLFRRHKKRELRMECAKRKKIRQLKRELEKQRKAESLKAKKELENDCVFILSSLIDQVSENAGDDNIKKVGRHSCVEENKSTNISRKYPVKGVRKKTDSLHDLENFKISKQGNVQFVKTPNENSLCPQKFGRSIEQRDEANNIVTHGKLSVQPHVPESPEDVSPKRLYQKSEFRDGNKKVEILEILEYLETSPETSDDAVPKNLRSCRRSKIPVPIYEKMHRGLKSKSFQKPFKNNVVVGSRYGVMNSPKTQAVDKHSNCRMDELIANILIDALHDKNSGVNLVNAPTDTMLADYKRLSSNNYVPIRRASVPQQEPVNSVSRTTHTPRYKQTFAPIPEERGSLSVESSNEDINLNQRSSLPFKGFNNNLLHDNNSKDTEDNRTKYVPTNGQTSPRAKSKNVSTSTNSPTLGQKNKDAGNHVGSPQRKNMKSATTSPMRRMVSAATSPIPQVPLNGNHLNSSYRHNGKTLEDNYKNDENNKTANGKKSLSSHGTREGWVGFYNSKHKHAGHDEGKQNSYDSDQMEEYSDKPLHAESDITPSSHQTVRTMESEKSKQITLNHEREANVHVETERRTEKASSKILKDQDGLKIRKNGKELGKRKKDDGTRKLSEKSSPKNTDLARRYSQSDPQLRTDYVITKTDTKKIEMISVQKSASEQSFDKSMKLPSFKGKQFGHSSEDVTSGTDSDSDKSLLRSLAPKWLSTGNGSRQKRLTRKKTNSQEQNSSNQNASGWSVTVAGNCYTTLPADVEMKLSFPKNGQTNTTSQSDSGFGDGECKSRRNLALMQRPQVPSCQCMHCRTPRQVAACGHTGRDRENSHASFLPPAQQNRRMTISMKKESTGSSVHTAKSTNKQPEILPDVETYRSSKSKSKNSVKAAVSDGAAFLPALLAARARCRK